MTELLGLMAAFGLMMMCGKAAIMSLDDRRSLMLRTIAAPAERTAR